MRKSRIFGILAVVFLLVAVLTVVLPLASVIYGVFRTGGSTLSGVQPSASGTGNVAVPTSFTVTNGGFLALNGVYLNVQAFSADGAPLYHLTIGPEDIPAGATAKFNIASPNATVFEQAFGNSTSGRLGGTIQLTAQVNLAGLIPIALTANIEVHPSSAGA